MPVAIVEHLNRTIGQLFEQFGHEAEAGLNLVLVGVPLEGQSLPVHSQLLGQFHQVFARRSQNFFALPLKLLFAQTLRLLDTEDVVAAMLVRQDALDAQLLIAFVAKGLHGLHIHNVSVTERRDDAVLVHERVVSIQVQQTSLLVVTPVLHLLGVAPGALDSLSARL